MGILQLVVAGGLAIAAVLVSCRSAVERERWFMPGTLGHEPGAPAVKPVETAPRGFLTRSLGGLGRDGEQEWAARNNLMERMAFSHNLARVFPPDLFDTHPEFFPWVEGSRLRPPAGSGFWNPDLGREDVARHAAEAARRHFAAQPDAPDFALGVNDALIWGESPELLALVSPQRWFRERPDYSNLVFTFMNRAAAELARTHPEKYLGALAYYWAENAPDFALHPQVVPFLTADRAQAYDAGFRREEAELQERWRGVAAPAAAEGAGPPRRMGIYDYLYGGGFLIPRVHTRLLAENLRQARRAGFTDYYAEVYPNWGLDGPMPWLTAQLLQQPEQSETALLDEYYRRYFREAAVPMRRFFELCERQWLRQPGPPYWLKHYRNESQAVIFPSLFCTEMGLWLNEAKGLARSTTVRERVELVQGAFGVTQRFVAFQEARDRLTRLALAGDGAAEPLEAALRDYFVTRREFISHTTLLRHTAPLALARFGWDDYLKNDPAALALGALHLAERRGGQPVAAGAAGLDVAPFGIRELARALAAAEGPEDGPAAGAELLRDAGMQGPPLPARTIAGLTYGVALPVEWTSRVEPAQFHEATLSGGAAARVLRLAGSKDTVISQWVPVGGDGLHRAAIDLRGRVASGTAVSLIFAWLDEDHRHVGFKAVRLPDGDWPEWVTLRQAGLPPRGAVWVGLGLRVQHQVEGDWLEARGFSLRH